MRASLHNLLLEGTDDRGIVHYIPVTPAAAKFFVDYGGPAGTCCGITATVNTTHTFVTCIECTGLTAGIT